MEETNVLIRKLIERMEIFEAKVESRFDRLVGEVVTIKETMATKSDIERLERKQDRLEKVVVLHAHKIAEHDLAIFHLQQNEK